MRPWLRTFCLCSLLALLITACDNPLLRPTNSSEDIKGILHEMASSVEKEEWKNAAKQHQRLKKAWKHMKTRVSINASQDDINDFEHEMVRLRGHIKKKDAGTALAMVYGLQITWEDLGQL